MGTPAYLSRTITTVGGGGAATVGTLNARVGIPRSIFWANKSFGYHFAYVPGLGAISQRIATPTGFTQRYAWNLNPNDGKQVEYLAAIAIKASTATDGRRISPYDYNNSGRSAAPDPTKLNDCENDGTETYYQQPDIASNGTLNGYILNVSVSQAFVTRCGTPAWSNIVVAQTATRSQSGGRCTSFVVGTHNAPRLGVNIGDGDPSRGWCPGEMIFAPGPQ